MELVLTPDLEQLINEQLSRGYLRTPAEVVREALLLLRARKADDVPRPQQTRVAGRLEAVQAKNLTFEIALKTGEKVRGTVTAESLPTVQALLGEDVLVAGLAFFKSTGEVDHVDVESVERPRGDVSVWSRLPRPLLGTIKRQDLERSPGQRLRDVMGKWPGNESDDEVFAALEELS